MKKIYIMALVLLALFTGNTNSAICMQKNTKQEKTNSFETKMTAFWQEFRMAVLSGDKDKVVEMTVFPFSIGGVELSKEQFNKYFNVIFNQSLPKSFSNRDFVIDGNTASFQIIESGGTNKVLYSLNFVEKNERIILASIFDKGIYTINDYDVLLKKRQSFTTTRFTVPTKEAIYGRWKTSNSNYIEFEKFYSNKEGGFKMSIDGDVIDGSFKIIKTDNNSISLKVDKISRELKSDKTEDYPKWKKLKGFLIVDFILNDDKVAATAQIETTINGKKNTITPEQLSLDYGMSYDLDSDFEFFFDRFKELLIQSDSKKIAEIINFPIQGNLYEGSIDNNSREAFIKNDGFQSMFGFNFVDFSKIKYNYNCLTKMNDNSKVSIDLDQNMNNGSEWRFNYSNLISVRIGDGEGGCSTWCSTYYFAKINGDIKLVGVEFAG